MSVVTNLVLCTRVAESEWGGAPRRRDPVALFNVWLAEEARGQQLVRADAAWPYGGAKALEMNVWIAALNYGPSIERIKEKLAELAWESPECVVLVYKEDDGRGPQVWVVSK